MKKFLSIVVIGAMFCGCASFGSFTPQGAQVATQAVTVAQGLLRSLDGFYDDLLTLKLVPGYTTQATRALSIADLARAILNQAGK